jgi:hypothetical protein
MKLGTSSTGSAVIARSRTGQSDWLANRKIDKVADSILIHKVHTIHATKVIPLYPDIYSKTTSLLDTA